MTLSNTINIIHSVLLVNTMHDLTGFQRDLLYVIAGLEQPHTASHSKTNWTSTTKTRSITGAYIPIWTHSSTRDWSRKGSTTSAPISTKSRNVAVANLRIAVSGNASTVTRWLRHRSVSV